MQSLLHLVMSEHMRSVGFPAFPSISEPIAKQLVQHVSLLTKLEGVTVITVFIIGLRQFAA